MFLALPLWELTVYNHIGKRSESDLRNPTPRPGQLPVSLPINLIDTTPVGKLTLETQNACPLPYFSISGFKVIIS